MTLLHRDAIRMRVAKRDDVRARDGVGISIPPRVVVGITRVAPQFQVSSRSIRFGGLRTAANGDTASARSPSSQKMSVTTSTMSWVRRIDSHRPRGEAGDRYSEPGITSRSVRREARLVSKMWVLPVFCEHAIAGYEDVDLGSHEAPERVLRRGDDRLSAHVEARVHQDRTAGARLECRQQGVVPRIRVGVYGLDSRRVIDVRDGRD